MGHYVRHGTGEYEYVETNPAELRRQVRLLKAKIALLERGLAEHGLTVVGDAVVPRDRVDGCGVIE